MDAYLAKREGKFGIKNHINSKCMKSKLFLILIWLTLEWESWVSILPIFPYQPMETKEPLNNHIMGCSKGHKSSK